MTRKKKWLIFSDPFPNIEWLADGILQSACQSLYVKESTTFKHEHRRMVYSLENKHEGSPECSSLYKYWNVLLKHTETNRKDVMLVHLWKVGKQECEVCCLVIRHEGTLFWKRDPDLLIPHPFLVAAKGKKMTDKKHFSIPAWQERYHLHIEPHSAQAKQGHVGAAECRSVLSE